MPLDLCITWEAQFGSDTDCSPQTPGADHNSVWIGGDAIESRVIVGAVAGNPATGVITDITKAAGKKGYAFYSHEDSIDMQSTQSVNDNAGRDLNEPINGRGFVTSLNYTFMEKNLNRWGYLLIKDNDDVLWGWYTKLNSFTAAFGVVQGDLKAISYSYLNTKRTRVHKIDLSVLGTHGDIPTFFTYLTT